jgi:hypothetical protein
VISLVAIRVGEFPRTTKIGIAMSSLFFGSCGIGLYLSLPNSSGYLLHSMSTDGRNLYDTDYGYTRKNLFNGLPSIRKENNEIDWSVKKLPTGISMLSVRNGIRIEKHQGYSVHQLAWSDKRESLFFLERQRPDGRGNSTDWLWSWSKEDGYKVLAQNLGKAEGLAVSLDQNFVSTGVSRYEGPEKIFLYDLREKSFDILGPVSHGNRPIVIDANTILLRDYELSNDYCTVWRWNPKTGEEPVPLDVSGEIHDVAILYGEIWAMRKDNELSLVQLDSSLSKTLHKIPYLGNQ